MATKKDLVEAHAFSRRRLVTAFLSGAPGGREVEPARPGRTIVGGIALAVLLVAAAAIASVLASKTEEDWNKVGLVVSREEAAPYVILEDEETPELIPILNITSAQLILGAGVEPTYVEQDVIEQQTPGETIGIFGAPQTLPRPVALHRRRVDGVHRGRAGHHARPAEQPGPGGASSAAGWWWPTRTAPTWSPGRVTAATPTAPTSTRCRPAATSTRCSTTWGWSRRSRRPTCPRTGCGCSRPVASWAGRASASPTPRSRPDDPAPYPPSARVGDYWVDGDEGLVLTRTGPMRLTPFAFQVFLNTPIPVEQPGQARQAPAAHRRRAAPGRRDRPDVRRRELAGAGARAAERPPVRAAPDDPRQASRGGAHAGPGGRHQRRERDRPRADRLRDRGRPGGVRVHRRLGRREQPDLVRDRPARARRTRCSTPRRSRSWATTTRRPRSCRTAGWSCSRRGSSCRRAWRSARRRRRRRRTRTAGSSRVEPPVRVRSGRRPGDRGPGRAARPRGVRGRRRGVPVDDAGRGLRDDAGQRTAGRDGRRQGPRLADPPRRGARGRGGRRRRRLRGRRPGRRPGGRAAARGARPAARATTTAPRWPA